jgi:hypothetical protein
MRVRAFVRRRPSAPLVMSFLALFVALGGVGWAAIRVPANSVGNAQLKPYSVGPRKIIPGSVGARQVNPVQVQMRVAGPCTSGAIQAIAQSGDVTCTPALPSEYGSSPATTTLGLGQTQVASESLPGGGGGSTYLAIGEVRLTAVEGTAGTQSVEVSCTLSAGSSSTSGAFTAELDSNQTAVSGTIPLVVPVAVSSSGQTAAVSCETTPASTVTVNVTINAIQTAANN